MERSQSCVASGRGRERDEPAPPPGVWEKNERKAGYKQQAMPPTPASLTHPAFAAAHCHTHVDQCSGSASLP